MVVDTRARRPTAASLVGWLAVLGAAGAATMTLAHLGLDLPVISELGPARMLLPVAVSFAVGTLLYAVVAAGAFRVRGWAWPAGVVVNGMAFVSAAFPYRGAVSAAAMTVSFLALAVLVSAPGRRAFRSSATA